jgi:hypothetical protein
LKKIESFQVFSLNKDKSIAILKAKVNFGEQSDILIKVQALFEKYGINEEDLTVQFDTTGITSPKLASKRLEFDQTISTSAKSNDENVIQDEFVSKFGVKNANKIKDE